MDTAFIINGGAGRVLAATPALEKFARLNPDDDFRVIIHGWESLYWGNPILQPRTFGVGEKGVFETHIRERRVVAPEPYHVHGYYNQQMSMAEAFDELINASDPSDIDSKPSMYVTSQERSAIRTILDEGMRGRNRPVIVAQPYGSGLTAQGGKPFDPTNRSMDPDQWIELARMLSKDFLVLFFGPPEHVHPADNVTFRIHDKSPDIRAYCAAIAECDYFFGVDSVGQHVARAFDKPGTVFLGSTFKKNVTYPDHFQVFRTGDRTPTYSPIRLGGIDCELAERLNDGIMTCSVTSLGALYQKLYVGAMKAAPK
jgi:hypothetical protein